MYSEKVHRRFWSTMPYHGLCRYERWLIGCGLHSYQYLGYSRGKYAGNYEKGLKESQSHLSWRKEIPPFITTLPKVDQIRFLKQKSIQWSSVVRIGSQMNLFLFFYPGPGDGIPPCRHACGCNGLTISQLVTDAKLASGLPGHSPGKASKTESPYLTGSLNPLSDVRDD